ncbi:MAG: hypothetical protein ACFFDT_24640, partial [Candidatus Hodarchaeota archaeon]
KLNHKFLVLFFGAQCPWHKWVIEQTRLAATQVKGTIKIIDAIKNPEIAAQYRLFCPFMIVIDDTIRLSSPFSANELVKIAKGGVTAKPTLLQSLGPEARAERIEPLTAKNILETCSTCNRARDSPEYQAKVEWALKFQNDLPEEIMGFIAFEGKKAVSYVEFLPALKIPYPLPKKSKTLAVINCIYPLEDGPDYRSYVLEYLIKYLPKHGFKKLQVISGRRTLTPNRQVSFFISHGFKEIGEVDSIVLKRGKDELVLMEKNLLKSNPY